MKNNNEFQTNDNEMKNCGKNVLNVKQSLDCYSTSNGDVMNEKDSNADGNDKAKENNDDEKKDGVAELENNKEDHNIFLFSIIGEIEGHEALTAQAKSTKYEILLPKLASIEDDKKIDGIIIILNTMGGDVEAGLAIAEMISSLSKPSVSLVLGGSHSIGVPIAVSTDYSYIVPSGTMVIHPVRMTGTVIGAPQTYKCFYDVQNRIIDFVCNHSKINKERLNQLMMETEVLTKDVGSILCGIEAVNEGIIDEVGGISQAIHKLHEMIDEKKNT